MSKIKKLYKHVLTALKKLLTRQRGFEFNTRITYYIAESPRRTHRSSHSYKQTQFVIAPDFGVFDLDEGVALTEEKHE